MSQINQIFQEVLKEILPRPQDLKIINDIVERLKRLLIAKAKDLNITYTIIEPQGSTGIKQTQLKYDSDLDLFIGASAIYSNMTLITRNVREFERLENIKIENWIDNQ